MLGISVHVDNKRRYSFGRASNPSRHIRFVNLNSNSLLTSVAETRDNVDIHDFG